MSAEYVCWVPAEPDEVMDRLDLLPHLKGHLDFEERTFTLQHTGVMTRNSWRPRMHGEVSKAGEGTLIEVKLRVHPFVFVFTLIHGFFLLGISWLMGAAAFSWEVPGATEALYIATGATLEGPDALAVTGDLSDPRIEGAEASPPVSFKARSGLEGARFSIRGQAGWLGSGPRSTLSVDAGGITVDGERISWDAVRSCALADNGTERCLSIAASNREVALRLPAGAHAETDVQWLADYLSSRAERWRASPEDARRLKREAAELTDAARPNPERQRE